MVWVILEIGFGEVRRKLKSPGRKSSCELGNQVPLFVWAAGGHRMTEPRRLVPPVISGYHH